jgi:hypothetical protein
MFNLTKYIKKKEEKPAPGDNDDPAGATHAATIVSQNCSNAFDVTTLLLNIAELCRETCSTIENRGQQMRSELEKQK